MGNLGFGHAFTFVSELLYANLDLGSIQILVAVHAGCDLIV